MAKSEVEELTKKTVQKGGMLVKLYFDMQSENKDDLQPLMTELINNNLMKAPGAVYCYGSVEEPIRMDNMYSTSATVVILFKDLNSLIKAVFKYPPAGVEIIKPEGEYNIKMSELQSVLIDIAQTAVDYSQYIMERVLTKDDLEKVKKDLKHREELGKRLLEKKGGKQSAGA
ncbi:MAG: hypothetical protein KGI00_00565 [Candidatus Micrarchaeota archaeon]|nr:hypothetical protein [Candidatus Micrarchaeota archaeon]MDE1823731.1 hypothetical protein [Candidatus Micrarchaeota archaeon]MDE1849205.1 hypothetical protein [Candidatus Micrarchaeota archaeon]